MTFKRCLVPLLTLVVSSAAYAQQSPYFPEDGTEAVVQEIREIRNPSVYLIIAIAPGFEDLAAIAKFRVGSGAAVSIAYVTNGEDLPSDLSGEMFYELASRRKEEAYQALSYLDVQSYFLNIPVDEFPAGPRCFKASAELTEKLTARLDSLISQVKPDIIVLDHDPLSGNTGSPRLSYLKNITIENLRHRNGTSPWNVDRLLVQTDRSNKSFEIPVEQEDRVWSKSYLQMAHEAEKFYQSLRYQIHLWDENQSHCYTQLYPRIMRPLSRLDKGLPVIGKELKALLPTVHSILPIEKIINLEKQLAMLSGTISKVDAFIYHYEYSISQSDMRVLTTWKLGLEKLRCAIMGVDIQYSVSDTVVTPIQLFFLKFSSLDTLFNKGKTQVLFPGVVQKQWIVNEAQSNFYDWPKAPLTGKDSLGFRVLSPRSIPLNSTETPEGFEAMQLRTPFVFMVAHQDLNPNHNFMYRQEMPLIVAPYRSIELLTPQVAMFHDTDICVRFRSNVRDKSGGVFYVNDPVVSSPQKRVELLGKNYVLTDTLPLIWKDTSSAAPHEVKIWASGKISIGDFLLRNLDMKSNIEKKIGLCSVIENGPVLIALRRLGASTTMCDKLNSLDKNLSDYSAIIIDQFSSEKFLKLFERLETVEQWISDGGRLIILPQFGSEQTNSFLGNRIKFSYLPVVGCNEEARIDSTDKLFHNPNEIDEKSLSSEPFAISYGGITGEDSDSSKVLIRSGTHVLLLEQRKGQGAIFYCALNLYPRLLEIDQNSYRLLANMLDY